MKKITNLIVESKEILQVNYRKISKLEQKIVKIAKKMFELIGLNKTIDDIAQMNRIITYLNTDYNKDKPILLKYISLNYFALYFDTLLLDINNYDTRELFKKNKNKLIFEITNNTQGTMQSLGRLSHVDAKKLVEKIINIDDTKIYTYLSPITQSDNIRVLIAYLTRLSSVNKPTERLNIEQTRDYLYSKYGHKNWFKRLQQHYSNYVRKNAKYDLENAIKILRSQPELVRVTKAIYQKSNVRKVYRGVPAASRTKDEIKNIEKSVDWVPATENKAYAIKFATGEVYTGSSENDGYVITYEIDYNSILFDYRLIGSVYQEWEININPQIAKITNIELFKK